MATSQKLESRALSERVRSIRIELYGEDGVEALADQIGIPSRTWSNYEAGVSMPATVALRFLDLTGTNPSWLLCGEGTRFNQRAGQTESRADLPIR